MRPILAFFLALAGAVPPAAAADDLPPAPTLSGFRIDIGPLVAQGAGAEAEALRADLTAALRREIGPRLRGRGPSLVVVVRGLSLRPYAGSQGRFGLGGTQSDYLDGETLLVGARGEVLGRRPQLAVSPSSSGGAWYDPAAERRRVTALADIYAGWLVRSLPAQ